MSTVQVRDFFSCVQQMIFRLNHYYTEVENMAMVIADSAVWTLRVQWD